MAYKIKSKFLKEKIQGKKRSRYFEDLIFAERWITGDAWGMGASMRWTQTIKDKYPKEIEGIWSELDLEGYKKFLQREERETIETGRICREVEEIEKKEREEKRREWIKAGGRLQCLNVTHIEGCSET